MHAIAANQLTCASGGCHEPATVRLLERRPTEAVTLALDGRVFFYEQPAAIVDFCGPCAVVQVELEAR
jgi:hypothetical protein